MKKREKGEYKGDMRVNITTKNNTKIDKHSIQYLKYRDIAIEFIKNRYSNIRAIYSKHYPKASEDSLRTEPYRLLDNVGFQIALEDAWNYIKPKDLDIAQAVVETLYNISVKGKKEADRIAAASWLGKCEAMFTDKSENTTKLVIKPEEVDELQRIRGTVLSISN